ncbi:succinate dehydrogenase, cytochrome b556 subunit [Kaustia mangrovi]|uniref:Succinate dehydrogenase cytochrome b556 subunit n=1 Tax=Kaustia mangrovi TaxID=2593653 RepID=A0A7S8C4H3_9HYPH|nr:succinate dehydrogenase, cytochrome b556 subunit [Kaustia mangrovi]QPC43217.1 succinate dehydrogenase, cytochrome b556 subunit [Kaustia mangrovi]
MNVQDRPLSPHLQVYRPMLTMMMSIVHRITGSALYVGTLLLAWWLVAAATGADAFSAVQWFLGSWLGLVILFGFTWALLHHMLGGLRHLLWDTGRGFEKPTIEALARATIAGSLALTVIVWIVGFALG